MAAGAGQPVKITQTLHFHEVSKLFKMKIVFHLTDQSVDYPRTITEQFAIALYCLS